jgi:hypothetical protein
VIAGTINLEYFKIETLEEFPEILVSNDIKKTLFAELILICSDCFEG